MKDKEIVGINLEFDLDIYLTDLVKAGDILYQLFHSINVHKQTKMIYHNINGKSIVEVKSFSSDKLLSNFTASLVYKLDSLYFQSKLVKEILYSHISSMQLKTNFNDANTTRIALHINTLLDNLIIHTLSLLEYTLTFISHFYSEKVINNWTKFYSSFKGNIKLEVFKDVFSKYNKSVIALSDYRNLIIHKNMIGFPVGSTFDLMTGKLEIKFGFSSEILKMCEKLNFKSKLNFANGITLHYSIALEFLKVCTEIFQVVFKDLFDENMNPKHYDNF